jgi:serine/threonine protein kinase
MQKESQVVEIRPDDIVLEEEIGRGSFAKVYRGKCRGQTVAVKVLHTQVRLSILYSAQPPAAPDAATRT